MPDITLAESHTPHTEGRMHAFHNDATLKATYLARVRAHRAADQLIHGQYWEHGKGCAVGCTIHSGHHADYETVLGIPRILARLEDGIFEGLVAPQDLAWPEQFLDAIPVGADLRMVWPQFALHLLSDAQYGVLHYVQGAQHTRQREAITSVVTYYQTWCHTGVHPAAAAAAAAAAYAATAAYAAATAAYAAAYAAAAAAYAATAAAAAAAAAYAATAAAAAAACKRHEARVWQAHTLLRLLRDAPVVAVKETV